MDKIHFSRLLSEHVEAVDYSPEPTVCGVNKRRPEQVKYRPLNVLSTGSKAVFAEHPWQCCKTCFALVFGKAEAFTAFGPY